MQRIFCYTQNYFQYSFEKKARRDSWTKCELGIRTKVHSKTVAQVTNFSDHFESINCSVKYTVFHTEGR